MALKGTRKTDAGLMVTHAKIRHYRRLTNLMAGIVRHRVGLETYRISVLKYPELLSQIETELAEVNLIASFLNVVKEHQINKDLADVLFGFQDCGVNYEKLQADLILFLKNYPRKDMFGMDIEVPAGALKGIIVKREEKKK